MAGDRQWVLAETNWQTVINVDYELAILPWGATEAHNYHLPYCTDNYQATAIAERSAELAWEEGKKVVVLPTIPFGVNTQQLDIKLTINMNPRTQAAILRDIVESLENHNIQKLVILNGHGGNDFRQMIREIQKDTPLFLAAVNWFQIPDTQDDLHEPGDHAGELETSLMLHLHEKMVRPLDEAGSGHTKRFRVTAMKEGWAWAPRLWTKVTADTGCGNPALSTAQKGEAVFKKVVHKFSDFLIELAEIDVQNIYE